MAIPRKRYNDKKKRRAGSAAVGGRRKSRFKRGFYEPINEQKYVQPMDKHMNSQPFPEYRSSWEHAFMKYCDLSINVISWGTEPFAIKYVSPKDNEWHRYYIDFVFIDLTGTKHLVEIKPKGQCNDPLNLAKWEAARDYCLKIGATFSVVTEVELKMWGLIK